MRISSEKNDPDYKQNTIGIKVFFDGVEQKNCYMADEERGYVSCYMVDAAGKIMYDPLNPDEAMAISSCGGVVRIDLPKYLIDA